jgi:hypothetical protein
MASTNSTSNIIVGAAAVAIGTGTPTVAGVDATFLGIRGAASGTPKNYRDWVQNLPAGSTVGTQVNGVYFKNCGFTQEGVEVSYSPDYGEVEVDQLLDVARLFKQKMSVQVKTTLAEPTLENLLVVWDDDQEIGVYNAGGANDRNIYITPGELGDAPIERHLLFVGPAPGGVSTKQRAYLASRAISIEASSQSFKRNEATVFPVTFRLLPDVGSSYSAYGKIVDVSA